MSYRPPHNLQKRCPCGRTFVVVKGYSESESVCGICLDKKVKK